MSEKFQDSQIRDSQTRVANKFINTRLPLMDGQLEMELINFGALVSLQPMVDEILSLAIRIKKENNAKIEGLISKTCV